MAKQANDFYAVSPELAVENITDGTEIVLDVDMMQLAADVGYYDSGDNFISVVNAKGTSDGFNFFGGLEGKIESGDATFDGTVDFSGATITGINFDSLSGEVASDIVTSGITPQYTIIDVSTGNIVGNTGTYAGAVSASGFTGPLTGAVTGNVTGNLTGNVTGAVTGNVTGNVLGNVTGDLTGDVMGNVTGNLDGNVTGDLTGNVDGSLSGSIETDADSAVNSKLEFQADAEVTFLSGSSIDFENADVSNLPIGDQVENQNAGDGDEPATFKFWSGTTSEYNSIPTKDPGTLYFAYGS